VIEGFSDAASRVLKLWMSFYSDRVGKRKPILAVGYFVTAMMGTLGLVTAIWQIVLIRMVAWMGRGARGPAIALSLVGAMALCHIFLIAFIPGAITVLTPSHGSVQAGKTAIGLYIFHTVVYAAASYPVGMLGDRMSMRELHVA
jgi:hypothetical protein